MVAGSIYYAHDVGGLDLLDCKILCHMDGQNCLVKLEAKHNRAR